MAVIFGIRTRKFRDLDERTLNLLGFFYTLCGGAPFQKCLFVLTPHDKSKAASASHNQIRAE